MMEPSNEPMNFGGLNVSGGYGQGKWNGRATRRGGFFRGGGVRGWKGSKRRANLGHFLRVPG